MSDDLLRKVPGTIGMRCPVCDKAQIARRIAIDPAQARLLYYPCSEFCAAKAQTMSVVYTTASRQVIPL